MLGSYVSYLGIRHSGSRGEVAFVSAHSVELAEASEARAHRHGRHDSSFGGGGGGVSGAAVRRWSSGERMRSGDADVVADGGKTSVAALSKRRRRTGVIGLSVRSDRPLGGGGDSCSVCVPVVVIARAISKRFRRFLCVRPSLLRC